MTRAQPFDRIEFERKIRQEWHDEAYELLVDASGRVRTANEAIRIAGIR